jgi:hypothetical protein
MHCLTVMKAKDIHGMGTWASASESSEDTNAWALLPCW